MGQIGRDERDLRVPIVGARAVDATSPTENLRYLSRRGIESEMARAASDRGQEGDRAAARPFNRVRFVFPRAEQVVWRAAGARRARCGVAAGVHHINAIALHAT